MEFELGLKTHFKVKISINNFRIIHISISFTKFDINTNQISNISLYQYYKILVY